MKTIVTHISPDLDAIAAIWLIRRFKSNWQDAEVIYVPAGETFGKQPVDSDPKIIHVDTGFGQFDHHQNNKFTCASKLVFSQLKKSGEIKKQLIPALERMVDHINEIDHFHEVFYENAYEDRYDFSLHQIVDSLKPVLKSDILLVITISLILDGLLQFMTQKVKAEQELKKGYVFKSTFGKSLALATKNGVFSKVAAKLGYDLIVVKDPTRGYIKIHTLPKRCDLTVLYNKLKLADPKATWFLHASHNIILNGSSKNPNFKPSTLTLSKLIAIIRGV